MLKFIRHYLSAIKDNEGLKKEVVNLTATLAMVKEESKSAIYVLDQLMRKGVPWYDIDKEPAYERRLQYYLTANALLQNDVLQNQANMIMAAQLEEAVLRAKTFEEVYGLRMSVNGIKALLESLEQVTDPRTSTKNEDPYSPT